jgi:ABC-type antimicrobial peptide transport system permease subunit
MRAFDLFQLSTRMFRTRPMRTWLTVLGISVGTGAVLFLVALGFGLQNIILQKIVFNKALLSLSVTSTSEAIIMDQTTLDKFRAIPGVVDIAPLARFTSQMRAKDLSGNVSLLATPASYFDYAGMAPIAGSLYGANDKDKIVVSEAVLRLFGFADAASAINNTVHLQVYVTKDIDEGVTLEVVDLPDAYTIVGVVEGPQDGFVYVPISDVSAAAPVNVFEQAQVAVSASDKIPAVKDAVLNMGFQVSSLSEMVDQANKIFSIIQIILGVFGAFALMVSSIGMFNTMTVTLLERTNEIGVMRAIGASRNSIEIMFLAESLIIGFLGGVVGVALGMLGGWLFNFGINILAARFGGAPIALFAFPLNFSLIIIAISTVIGFLSGVFPSRRAAHLDPLEALRYK